jgi:hypothetical protein
MITKNAIDIFGDFGEACREEFRSLGMGAIRRASSRVSME